MNTLIDRGNHNAIGNLLHDDEGSGIQTLSGTEVRILSLLTGWIDCFPLCGKWSVKVNKVVGHS